MSKEIVNIKASVRARLQNIAKETNRPFQEVLQYYGMERFLYRFCQSQYADQFILKGSLLFTVWDVAERRPTVDIDFAAEYDSRVDAIVNVFKNLCNLAVVTDGLEYDGASVVGERIREGADYEGVRVKFTGLLERAAIPMQIDIAFGDKIYPRPQKIVYPVILNMKEPILKGYPVESVLSEKFEAMVKLGSINSRMKDFYDIWISIRKFNFRGEDMRRAIKNTFEHRKTALPTGKVLFAEEIYDYTSDRQNLWRAFLNKNGVNEAPQRLKDIAKEIEKFLAGPIEALSKSKEFDKEWRAPGPWR